MMLKPVQEAALDVLRTRTPFAVIGISAQPQKHGHEVFETLLSGSYAVYRINPKYREIDRHRRYPPLADLPTIPEAVVSALTPQLSEQTVPEAMCAGAWLIGLPPGCFKYAAKDAPRIGRAATADNGTMMPAPA